MSKGTLTTAQAERSAHHIMRNKLNIRNVQLIFSVIMFLTFAGLTGCRDKDSEFLEKRLEQEENSQDSLSRKAGSSRKPIHRRIPVHSRSPIHRRVPVHSQSPEMSQRQST